MKKVTKAMSLALSAAMALSSAAALSITASAADNSISFGGEQKFDAVRITYKNGKAPENAVLGINGAEYSLAAGEAAQVINVNEDTTASSITLTDYNAADVEVKLLAYDRIEMLTKTEADELTSLSASKKPYLAASWQFATGSQKNTGNCTDGTGWRYREDIKTATRYNHLFDGEYDADGVLTNHGTRNMSGYDGYKEVNINFNFLEQKELAKIRVYHNQSVNSMNNWTIGVPEKKMTGKNYNNEETYDSIDRSQTYVTMDSEYIQKSERATQSGKDSNGTTTDNVYIVDLPLNITTDVLQISLADAGGVTNGNSENFIYELEFYTYKDVYTVGEKTYILDLEDAPDAFNAVRLTYDTPQTFSGTSQFYDTDGNKVGDPQQIIFNNTMYGAAVLDTATVASKTAAKVEITVPDGIGEPTAEAYLKYSRSDIGNDISSKMYSEKGYENSTGEHVIAAWGTNNINFANLFDADYDEDDNITNTKQNCGWYHNASTVKDTNATDSNAVDSEGIYKLYIPLGETKELAKVVFYIVNGQETSYQLTTVNGDVKNVNDKISVDIVKGLANDTNVGKQLDLNVNATVDEIDVKLADFANTTYGMTGVRELLFYTYEEIKPEVTPIAPTATNTFVKNITSEASEDIKEGTSATAVLSEIDPGDYTVETVKWTYGSDKTATYDGTAEGNTTITDGPALFGLILDWGSEDVPEDFDDLSENAAIPDSVIKTEIN